MRYKEYNVNRVLEKSIQLFWKNGFRGCSVKDIVEVTGVNRFSLYHEFADKSGILYGSLQLYRERYCEDKFNILKEEGHPEDILKKFYLSFLREENIQPGCFFIHIGTEMADTDEKIKSLIKSYLKEIQGLLFDLLTRNERTNEHANFCARHLVGLFCTTMSFCLIHSEKERAKHISNGIKVILNKNTSYATST